MSEMSGTGRRPTAPSAATVVHEEYSFVCLRCGHGWEQAYEIEHRTDAQGATSVVYTADGRETPSPLSSPSCGHCGGHKLRIMRPGRVAKVRQSMREAVAEGHAAGAHGGRGTHRGSGTRAGSGSGTGARPDGDASRAPRHLWKLSHLVRLLHLRPRVRT